MAKTKTKQVTHKQVLDEGLPVDERHEREVLGTLLLVPELFFEKTLTLSVDDFYIQAHQEIYRAICSVAELELPINFATVHDEMTKTGTVQVLPPKAGMAFMAELTTGVPRRAHKDFDWMLTKLHQLRVRRGLIRACWQTIAEAQTAGVDPREVITGLDSTLLTIASDNPTAQAVKIGDVFPQVYRRLKEEATFALGDIPGYRIGVPQFDESVGYLRRREVSVWAGYQKDGKTSMAMQAIDENTVKRHVPTLYLSHEMDREAVVLREIAIRTDIPFYHLRNPRLLDDFDHAALDRLDQRFREMPLWVEDTAMDLASIAARVRLHCRRDKCELIIVDFIQKIKVPEYEKRHEQVSAASDTIRVLAKQENCHAMVLSQLANPEGRKKVPPNQFMLKESGDIASDCHLAAAVWRPVDSDGAFTGEDELRILLQRSGPTGTAIPVKYNTDKLIFQERTTNQVAAHRDDN